MVCRGLCAQSTWLFIVLLREEDPVGNWTLNVYDVDNPESKGFMLNWTLTLFGEQDPEFVGTPIHSSTGLHDDKEHEVSITPTTSTAKPISTSKDNTPSRPTRIKPEDKSSKSSKQGTSSTTTASSSSSSSSETPVTENEEADTLTENLEDDHSYLTVVYAVVGSFAILGVATGLYFYKRQGWKSPVTMTTQDRQLGPGGYEFDVLQPLTELDEDELSESDTDDDNEVDRLVRNNH